MWKNDSSALTECPGSIPSPAHARKRERGRERESERERESRGLRVDDGVYYELRGRGGKRVAGDGEMPAPDSLIAAAQLCVPL